MDDAERRDRRRATIRRYYERHREEILAYQREHKARHNEHCRRSYWKHHEHERARGKAYAVTHKAERMKRWQTYYRENREAIRARNKVWRYKSRYGITPEYKAALLTTQGNLCAICSTARPGPRGWHVDHDHVTNEVRGILCGLCNIGLGQFGDDVNRLRSAIAYMENPPARTVRPKAPQQMKLAVVK